VRKKTSRILIGLFVAVGFFLGLMALAWLEGLPRYFKKSVIYVTYFDTSVLGLQQNSDVTFMGVNVGRIKSIGVAPDNRLIEVEMEIYRPELVTDNTIAHYTFSALTTQPAIDLRPAGRDEGYSIPELTFPVEHPVIASRPSELDQIFSHLVSLTDELQSVDYTGLSTRLESTAAAVQTLIEGDQLSSIMGNLETVMRDLQRTASELNRITEQHELQKVVEQAHSALSEATTLLASMRLEMEAMNLPETVEESRVMVVDLKRRTDALTVELYEVIQNVERTSMELDMLVERLHDNPSELLFPRQKLERRGSR
jgi:phospholipid/cholesterol/gamma-HCH transport system substrate-binding protein